MIRPAQPEEMDAVRAIFREYAGWVGDGICFQSFERELTGLPGRYAPPGGRLVLSVEDSAIAGCAALRQLGPYIGEMKRLYVRPAFRGRNLGRLLLDCIVAEASEAGYALLRLDTLPHMERAIALYRQRGFYEIPRYGDNPDGAICFEMKL